MSCVDHPVLTPAIVISAVERIVAACHPRVIYVFGSRARGEARLDSDLDLLVVLRSAVPDAAGLRCHLRSLLKDLPVAKDILVSEPAHFAFWSQHRNSVYRTAVQEGFPLWEETHLDRAVAAQICR